MWLCHSPKTKAPPDCQSWRLGLQVPIPLSGKQQVGPCFFVFMAPTPSRVHGFENLQRVVALTTVTIVASGGVWSHSPLNCHCLSSLGRGWWGGSHVTEHQWPLVRSGPALSSFSSPQASQDCLLSSPLPAAATPQLLIPLDSPA